MIAQVNSSWTVRVDRKELVEFQVDGTHGSAVVGPVRLPHPAPQRHAQAGLEPRPRRDPRLRRRLDRASRTTTRSRTGSRPSGSSSSATSWRTPRTSSTSGRRARRAAGRGGPRELPHRRAGRPARARRPRARRGGALMAVVTTIDAGGAVERADAVRRARLPPADRPAAQPRRLRRRARRAAGRRRERPRRTRRHRLGRHPGVPPPRLVVGPRRRRRHGHRAAQHGPRRQGHARADRPQRGRGAVGGRRAGGRGEHRPRRRGGRSRCRPWSTPTSSSCTSPRTTGAGTVLMASTAPRPGRDVGRPTTSTSTARCSPARAHRSCCTGWAPRSTPSSPTTSALRTCPPTSTRSRASSAENAERVRGIKMSLLDADARDRAAVAAAAGRHDVHRRRLQLRRPHRGRRPAALGRAARRVRGGGAQRFGRDPGPRRGRPGRVPADPRARPRSWPGTSSPRPPSTTRPASPSCPGSTATSRRSRWWAACTRRAACRTCPRWCGWPNAAGALEHPELAADALERLPRAARRGARMSRPAALAEPGHDQVRRPARPHCASPQKRASRASGCGGSRWPKSGSPPPPAWSPTPGCGCRRCCRGGFFTAADDAGRRAALDDNRRAIEETATLAAAGAPGSAPVLVLVAGGLPGGSGISPARATRVRDAIGELVADATAAGVVLAIEPLHPMYAADRARDLDARAGARRRRAVPRRGGRRRRRHLPRLVGPAARRPDRAAQAGTVGSRATRSATGSPRSRPTPCSRAG